MTATTGERSLPTTARSPHTRTSRLHTPAAPAHACSPPTPTTRLPARSPTRAAGETAAAVADAERALELGGPRDLLGESLVALVAFYRGDYEQAVSGADAAIEINPDVPDVWLLKSAAELAIGDSSGADASLTKALRLLDGSDPSQRTRFLAASYLSYLGSVAHNRPALAPQAQRLADRVVATETAFTLGRKLPGAVPTTGRVQIDDLRFANGRLGLVIRWQGLPEATALGAVAYERPLAHGAWTQPADLALFATIGGNGMRRISVPLSRVCEPTAVRADIYLDGAPALTTIGPGVPATC